MDDGKTLRDFFRDDGWGEAGSEANQQGLYSEGPRPSRNPLQRLIVTSKAQGEPLPAPVARVVLSREGQAKVKLLRAILRGGVIRKTEKRKRGSKR